MAFPIVEATAESSTNTAGTSHIVNLPANIKPGDILLVFMALGSTAATINALAGWSEVVDAGVANGTVILCRTADGTEGATVTFTSSANTRDATITYRISNAMDVADQLPQISTVATGTSTGPDPGTCTPTGSKEYLWIAQFSNAGEEADDDTWANTAPSGYSGLLQKACGIAGSNLGGMCATAHRSIFGSSENPGAFNQDASLAWRAFTVAVHPLPPVGTYRIADSIYQLILGIGGLRKMLKIPFMPPAEAFEYTDSATAYLDLQSSGTELAEFVDTVTVSFDLQSSGTELQEAVDSAEVYLDLQSSGTETLEHETLDSAEIYLDLQSSGTELQEAVDSAQAYVDMQPASVELAEFTDTAEVYFDLQASGTEEIFTPIATVQPTRIPPFMLRVPFGLLQRRFPLSPIQGVPVIEDSATVYLDITITSTDIADVVETTTVPLDLQSSGTDLLDVVDLAEIYLDLQATSVEAADFVDSDSIYVDLFAYVVEEYPVVYFDLESSGTEIHEGAGPQDYLDSATVGLLLTSSAVEFTEFIDSATIPFDLVSSGTDAADFVDTPVVVFDLQALGTESITAIELAEVYLDLLVAGADIQEFAENATAYLDLLPTTTDIAQFVDATTIILTITPTGVEDFAIIDAAQVYLDIQPGVIFVQVDFSLEIVGYQLRWSVKIPVTRWEVVGLILQWALLETRRTTWRS